MPSTPYCVSVVVDLSFAGSLFELLETGPLWIVDTTHNRALVESIWDGPNYQDHRHGPTLFTSVNAKSPEERFLLNLDTIDLHHGVYSADPPYTVLNVLGTPITERVEAELEEYGFDRLDTIEGGFRAQRPLPGPIDK